MVAILRHKAQQFFFPEQATQNGVHIQAQQFFALQAGSQGGNAVVLFIGTNAVLVIQRTFGGTSQIVLPLDGHALNHQPCGHFIVGGQHNGGVQLLRLAHVMLQHMGNLVQRLTVCVAQRHHPLVRLLAWQAVFGVQRDGAAAFAMHIHQFRQLGTVCHRAIDRGRGTQPQIGLHFSHRHLHGAITKDLKNKCAVELDVGLHQHAGSGHFPQQLPHRGRIWPSFRIVGAALEDVLPGIGQTHDHAAHGQAIEKKFMEFRHAVIPV